MIKWEELNAYQKAAFWIFIGVIGWFAPEIALLFHFGGIEVVFAFLAMYYTPLLLRIKAHKAQFSQALLLAYVSLQTSAVAQPKIYFLQAGFFTLAFVLTSSIAFSSVFLMPGLVFNGVLTG